MKYVGQKLSIAVKINILLISNIWNVLFLFESNDMIFHICNWTLFLFLFSFRKVWWSSQKSFNHAVKGFENSFWDFIFFYMKAILKRPVRHLNCSWQTPITKIIKQNMIDVWWFIIHNRNWFGLIQTFYLYISISKVSKRISIAPILYIRRNLNLETLYIIWDTKFWADYI